MPVSKILNDYGYIGQQLLVNAVRPISATGNTEKSIGFKVESIDDGYVLRIFARQFFSTLETGRGPRKSNRSSGFEDNMLEYLKARGIGTDLSDKKRQQLARFLTWKINKEGDNTFKKGGRQVYSNDLQKFIEELRNALSKDFVVSCRTFVKSLFNVNNSSTSTIL